MLASEPTPEGAQAEPIRQRAGTGKNRGHVELVAVFAHAELEIVDATRHSFIVRDDLAIEKMEPGPYAATGRVTGHVPPFVMIMSGIVAIEMTTMRTR